MRPATDETRKFVLAYLTNNSGHSNNEFREMINACSKRHFQLVKEASMGQGFDRHLFGLKFTAERLNMPVPDLYTDSVNEYVNNFIISTSTLSTDTVILGGFGPVVHDGFGIGYNVGTARLGAVVSTYKSQRNTEEFVKCFEESLNDIKDILDKTNVQ